LVRKVIKLQVLITAAVILIKLQILITTTKTHNAAPIRIDLIMFNPLVNLIQNCCSQSIQLGQEYEDLEMDKVTAGARSNHFKPPA